MRANAPTFLISLSSTSLPRSPLWRERGARPSWRPRGSSALRPVELSRADFYNEKELSFQVSCSYGPGRYDPLYEEGGQGYPAGFVRWTEQRNFEAVLDMLADGRLRRRRCTSPAPSAGSAGGGSVALRPLAPPDVARLHGRT